MKQKTIIGLVFLAFICVDFFVFGGVTAVEHPLQDLLVQRHASTRAPDSDVVVIDVDDASLVRLQKQLGVGWPLPRSLYAQLLQGVLRQRPKAVLFDIYFVDPDRVRPQDDKYLVDVAAASDKVYFPVLRLEGADDARAAPLARFPPRIGFRPGPHADPDARAAFLFPLPQLAMTGRLGDINFLQDSDKVGRRYYTYYQTQGWRIASLPTKVAHALNFPVPTAPAFLLNWNQSVTTVPFYPVYQDMQRSQPKRPATEFTDKIVIIGSTAAGLGDVHPTPVSAAYPGVDILATAMSNLAQGDWMRRTPVWVGALVCLLLISLAGGLSIGRAGLATSGVTLVLASLALVGAGYLLLSARWLLPVTQALIFGWASFAALTVTDYLRERRERNYAIGMFGRFLDPRVVAEIVKVDSALLSEQPISREVTVMFSDIRGFTTLSETRSPEEVVSILNRYFTRQVEVIRRHGGTTDKFIGDCIMAFWGAPVPDEEQARHAVGAALEMAEVLLEFRRDLGDLAETFDIGIGIHTGPAVIGFMGSKNKLDYTAIGDSVNLASRIEGQTKGVARVLVSAATRERCGEVFEFTARGTYKVKGREEPVELFEPRERRE